MKALGDYRFTLIFSKHHLGKMTHNVSVVYDVFAVAIKEREAFQQPQKCAGMSRGRRSRPRRMEAEGL